MASTSGTPRSHMMRMGMVSSYLVDVVKSRHEDALASARTLRGRDTGG
jgi:hypothetical protein